MVVSDIRRHQRRELAFQAPAIQNALGHCVRLNSIKAWRPMPG